MKGLAIGSTAGRLLGLRVKLHARLRGQRGSLLPALTVDGYLDYISSTIFEAFIEEQVLPYCSPYPGP